MAHNEDDKIKIRAFYECNDLSYGKVAEHFADMGIEVSKKTIEYWGRKEGWKRNRFASMQEAVEALIPSDVLENVGEAMKEKIVSQMVQEAGEPSEPLEAEVLPQYVEAVSEEMIYQTLNRRSLLGKMAKNLNAAELIADRSPSIGVKATFHQMVTSAITTVYGKKVEMVPQDPNNKLLDDRELSELSTEELLARLEHL